MPFPPPHTGSAPTRTTVLWGLVGLMALVVVTGCAWRLNAALRRLSAVEHTLLLQHPLLATCQQRLESSGAQFGILDNQRADLARELAAVQAHVAVLEQRWMDATVPPGLKP